jgi:acyl-CoA thioester hydrolase
MKIEPAKIQVRFSDCDMMGHVNNAVYLSYFEMARIYYFGMLLAKDRDWKKEGVLLRKNEVEYLKPVLLHDVPQISVYLENIGSKSFTVAYELRVDNELRTIGKSVLVCYNSIENKTFEVTEELRSALEKIRK